jgi:geranylgeranyl pyrophosphate synthase
MASHLVLAGGKRLRPVMTALASVVGTPDEEGGATSANSPYSALISQVAEDATPMTQRSVPWITHPFALWEDPADPDRAR